MLNVLVNHKVNDYDAWKTAFDNFADVRKAGGEKSFRILHPSTDRNDLTLLFEWDSMENAEKFFTSTELKNTMSEAGVTEEPKIQFLQQLDKGTL